MEKSEMRTNGKEEMVVKVFKRDSLKHSIRKDVTGILGHGEVRGNVELGNALYSSVLMVINGNHAAVLRVLDRSELDYEFVDRNRAKPADGTVGKMEIGNA